MTFKTVASAQRQMQIPYPEGEALIEKDSINDRVTWVLLIYWDRRSDEVRCEVSLPRNVENGAFICDWSERIILPRFFETLPQPELLIIPEAAPIDVPVQRRAS